MLPSASLVLSLKTWPHASLDVERGRGDDLQARQHQLQACSRVVPCSSKRRPAPSAAGEHRCHCFLRILGKRAVYLAAFTPSQFFPSLHRESCAAHHHHINRVWCLALTLPASSKSPLPQARQIAHPLYYTCNPPPVLRPSPTRRV
jgi:hypothetical protein